MLVSQIIRGQQMNILNLNARLMELKKHIIKQENTGVIIDGTLKHIIFFSFSDSNSRAYVSKGMDDSFEKSWELAVKNLEKKIQSLNVNPIWLKVDIVTKINEFSLQSFIKYISNIKVNYFREGIVFDRHFKLAFLEQEVNANVFIHEIKNPSMKILAWKNINFYIKNNIGLDLRLDDNIVQSIYTFNTSGAFDDGLRCYALGNKSLDNGRRCVESLDLDFLQFIIQKSSDYLSDQVNENGEFRYGYFPCFNKEIQNYNILRHASTTYSMIEAYEITKSLDLKESINRAIKYLISEGVKLIKTSDDVERAFIVEKSDDDSIKLGANAAALLAFSKYTEVFSDNSYLPMMHQLAEGIVYFQKKDGSFVHVLNFSDLSVREEFRIIYYDGEATFALMRLFAIDENLKWLRTVERAFEYFINKKYWNHNDHWLSYCSYEIFLHRPERKYLEFNLKNAEGILDFCLTRETTYPTLLELLMATHKIIKICKEKDLYPELIADFDQTKLNDAIDHRAKHQLNGFLFPEVAMYFKVPKNILWSFYIRHHSFRVRIDDVEHNLSGYCSYYQNYLSQLKEEQLN